MMFRGILMRRVLCLRTKWLCYSETSAATCGKLGADLNLWEHGE